MDELVKVYVLLGSSLFLWLVPPAFKLPKLAAVISFNGSISCLIVAAATSKRLLKVEQLINKQNLLEEDLLNSELAWQADQREQELRQKYLAEPAPAPPVIEPEIEPDKSDSGGVRQKLEGCLKATDQLINELIDRNRTAEPAPPLLSKGSQKLLEYAAKKDWLEVRTIAKNWGRHNEFNAKEIKSFCDELVKANLAEWGGEKWRILAK